MRSALRIASITQCLREILQRGLHANSVADIVAGSDTVSVLAPDKIDVSTNKENSQLNLFMYQVSFNQGWRNFDQPSVNSNGERISNPPLAIDLHYFLTAYGKGDLDANILLGYGMQIFHEIPVLDRAVVRNILSRTNLRDPYKDLADSKLADQVEQIKITPELLSIEDISKLWAAFGAKYRTTAAYKITVVLIESDKTIKAGLPVIDRNIYVNTMKHPFIEKILSQKTDDSLVTEGQKILPGHRLILKGTELIPENAMIDIDGKPELGIPTAAIRSEKNGLSFIIPDNLKTGIHELMVVYPQSMGTPPIVHDHAGARSNAENFVLSPLITILPVSERTNPGNLVSATINLKVRPKLYPGQEALLSLNEITDSQDAKAYGFKYSPLPATSPPEPVENISIKIAGVKKAIYTLRLNVAGIDSPLTIEAGKFASPKINLL